MSHNTHYVNPLISGPERAAEGARSGLPSVVDGRANARPSGRARAAPCRSLLALAVLTALCVVAPATAQTDPQLVPGPDDALVFEALTATITVSASTSNSLPATGTGRRRPLASGSPSSAL